MNIFNGFYSILIIIVALLSIAKGYRMGISQQIASLLGFGFGAVASRVLLSRFLPDFSWTTQYSQAPEFDEFTLNLTCAVVIYAAVFTLFSFTSPILQRAMAVVEVGIINRLLGAFFSLLKNILWVSIALNLLLCISTKSGLLYYEKSNDGNLVGSVMQLTPAILGCPGAEDFALINQLKEAKYISRNVPGKLKDDKNVIKYKPAFPDFC